MVDSAVLGGVLGFSGILSAILACLVRDWYKNRKERIPLELKTKNGLQRV
jgi:hypothetical protein